VGALLCLATLGFIGFEAAAVYTEESKDPRRTVPRATYLSLAIIALLYTFAAWAMSVATGPDRIVEQAQAQGTELLFTLAAANLGPAFADIGHALFVTSLLAALVSFHNTTARYVFALGRERVLPAPFGRTSVRTGAPAVASATLSLVSVAVIVGYAVNGWDPLVALFYWGGTSGAVGVLLLLATTSLAVVCYFARQTLSESLWRRVIAPTLALVALAVVVALTLSNLDVLLGVAPDHPLRYTVPAVYLAAAILGIAWALILRFTRPDVYAGIGLGAKAATAGLLPPSLGAGTDRSHR
jgi:amino acid transporter